MMEMSFEDAMKRLKEISDILEAGKCDIDASLKLFEEGTRLIRLCNETLDSAEQKIVSLESVTAGQESV